MEVLYPRSKFISGTNLLTTIDRWEIVGARVYVVFQDGFRMKSEETPTSVRKLGAKERP